jgi:hypothetical protein
VNMKEGRISSEKKKEKEKRKKKEKRKGEREINNEKNEEKRRGHCCFTNLLFIFNQRKCVEVSVVRREQGC